MANGWIPTAVMCGRRISSPRFEPRRGASARAGHPASLGTSVRDVKMLKCMGALCFLLLASCGGPLKTYAPDGKEAYIIQCTGGRYACAKQAGDLCGPRGYSTLDQAGRVVPPQAPV